MERLTQNDLDALTFIARAGVVQPRHLELRFGFKRATAYRRILRLKDHGLITSDTKVVLGGGVFVATRDGIALSDKPLRVADPSWNSIIHDLKMTETVAYLERAGIACITEREAVAFTRTEESQRYVFPVRRTAGTWVRTHRADIVCEFQNRDAFVAIEVELSPKNNDRWDAYLHGYANRIGFDGFAGVLYLYGPRSEYKRLATRASYTRLRKRFQMLPVDDENIIERLVAMMERDRPDRRAA